MPSTAATPSAWIGAVALFADLGCNMIRCWGGNVYEDHRFFDLCDEEGILVWQDFAFACCRYPQTEDFLAEVRREAEPSSTSCATTPPWRSGAATTRSTWPTSSDGLSPEHNRLTREVIPQVRAPAATRTGPYVPSSPYVPPRSGRSPDALAPARRSSTSGGRAATSRARSTPLHSAHFIGEIGYHGCPNVSSIRRFISPGAAVAVAGQRRVAGARRLSLAAPRHRPGSHQADGQPGARAVRRASPTTWRRSRWPARSPRPRPRSSSSSRPGCASGGRSGILWWNVIDGWPQFSDAIVDYYFGKKLAYHYIRRVQRPVCVIVGEPGPGKYLPVVVCNDTPGRTPTCATGPGRRFGRDGLPRGTFRVAGQPELAGGHPAHLCQRPAAVPDRVGDRRPDVRQPLPGGHAALRPGPVSQVWLPAIAALPQPFDSDNVAR